VPPLDSAKARAREAIQAADAELRELSLDIHAHPELNFEEHHAHALLTDYLEAKGFTVTRGACDLPTAFSAVAGSGSPTIAVLCEYDALPEIGHACGHNLIAASGVAAGLALKAALAPGEGTVLVLGTPAEEGGGGKIAMIERGAFDGVDAAMMLHPSAVDTAWANLIAIQRLEIDYYGRNAHAGAAPWMGVNALDALVMSYTAISALRQQLRPTDRVHGIFTQAGAKPNIIPDHTAAEYYVRAANIAQLRDVQARVQACFEGAATATGCTLDFRVAGYAYTEVVTNNVLAEAYCENMQQHFEVMLPTRAQSVGGLAGASTDMGNVTYEMPGIHPIFAIPTSAGNHTAGFTEAAATPEAHAAMLRASTALAMTALDLYHNPALLAAAKQEFMAIAR